MPNTSRRTPSPRTILLVVAFGVFVAADDLTVVSTMLRQIIFDLEIPLPDGLDQAAWIVNAYLIAYVVVMPFIGRLSDIWGRRNVYVASLILFLVGSIWVPLAPDLNSFIVGRVLTALGGGAMVPVAMAVIGDVYPRDKRASALGALGAIDTAGWVWGPLYGAVLIRFLSWQWQFYLNIPLSLIGIAAAWWALRDLPEPKTRERIDWLGTAVLTISLISLNIALLNSGDVQAAGGFAQLQANEPSTNTTLLYVIAAVTFIIFVAIEYYLGRRAEQPETQAGALSPPPPLIDLTLFRRRNFSPAILVNFLVGGILIIAMVNVPLLINVLEFDVETAALTSGYLLSGMTGAMAITAWIGGQLTERVSYRPVTAVGLLFCAVGMGLMGWLWLVDTPYLNMALHLVVLGAGFGLVIAPIGTAVINAAPEDQRGIASSLVIVLRLMGMSVGLSGLTAWGLYRFEILRKLIELPNLPLSDPTYQQALANGLTEVTVEVLTETFLISAGVALLALLVAFWLKRD
ncbi:MAG: MFS transporter [Ardenticatenaceae bacterium]|nr:MFS transporter [Ardenticatenaceae bacterium]MCB8947003.1 MFS transporter [Ardenticatenaceae bacterium]